MARETISFGALILGAISCLIATNLVIIVTTLIACIMVNVASWTIETVEGNEINLDIGYKNYSYSMI